MMSVLENKVSALYNQNAVKLRASQHGARKREITSHDLGSNDNGFLEVVVDSVKTSIRIKQQFEDYT